MSAPMARYKDAGMVYDGLAYIKIYQAISEGQKIGMLTQDSEIKKTSIKKTKQMSLYCATWPHGVKVY